MSNQQHPITPPTELRCQWQSESPFKVISVEREDYMIDRAAQWGADQELEACCDWIEATLELPGCANQLRLARRPKPPSLKEQALKTVNEMSYCMSAGFVPKRSDLDTILHAIEALDD
jgi:hypothetical protein